MSKNFKSRYICGILYPDDNENHKRALSIIQKNYDYLFICHDKDTYTFDVFDDNGVVIHSKGELKKPHYHILLHFINPRYTTGVAKELGIEDNLLQKCSSADSYIIYLSHKDEPLKYQYDVSDFSGTLINKVFRVYEKPADLESQFNNIVDFIENHRNISYRELGRWCSTYGYLGIFLKYQSYFKEIYYECKTQYYERRLNL